MRIIAGEAKGRVITAPQGLATRPTQDFVREAVFNLLQGYVDGARVLDLFAGSGAFGLEALSRGASFAHFNDKAPAAHGAIVKNVATLSFQDRCMVTRWDYRHALERLACQREPFHLVFLDPPYQLVQAYGAAETLQRNGLLGSDALVVMEHGKDVDIPCPPGLAVRTSRAYGDTKVTLLEKA